MDATTHNLGGLRSTIPSRLSYSDLWYYTYIHYPQWLLHFHLCLKLHISKSRLSILHLFRGLVKGRNGFQVRHYGPASSLRSRGGCFAASGGLNRGKMVLLRGNLRPRGPRGLRPSVPRAFSWPLVILHSYTTRLGRPNGQNVAIAGFWTRVWLP